MGEEEVLREIFQETLDSIRIKPEMEKLKKKMLKKEKKRNIVMMIKEMDSQKESIRRGINGGELKFNQKTTVLQEFQTLEKLTKKTILIDDNVQQNHETKNRKNRQHIYDKIKTLTNASSRRMKTDESAEDFEHLKKRLPLQKMHSIGNNFSKNFKVNESKDQGPMLEMNNQHTFIMESPSVRKIKVHNPVDKPIRIPMKRTHTIGSPIVMSNQSHEKKEFHLEYKMHKVESPLAGKLKASESMESLKNNVLRIPLEQINTKEGVFIRRNKKHNRNWVMLTQESLDTTWNDGSQKRSKHRSSMKFFSDISPSNFCDETPKVSLKHNLAKSMLNSKGKEEGTIKVYDKRSLKKIQKELLQQKDFKNEKPVSLPYLQEPPKRKTLLLLDDDDENPYIISTNLLKNSFDFYLEKKRTNHSPTKSDYFQKFGDLSKSDYNLTHKKTTSSFQFHPYSPTASVSPTQIGQQLYTPLLSPISKNSLTFLGKNKSFSKLK